MARARTSTHSKDDILVIDTARPLIHLLVGDKGAAAGPANTSEELELVSFAAADVVAAVLPLQANRDALDDLVVLQRGRIVPALATTQGTVFVVNDPGDDRDATKGDGNCLTTNDEDGVCTLRAAIEEANANPDKNEISFLVDKIVPKVGFPAIIHPVDILGGESRVEIDGSKTSRILGIDGGSSMVSRMILHSSFTGILIRQGGGNKIVDCWVGNVVEDEAAKGNFTGIEIQSSLNVIGGTADGARNIISGNPGPGVKIFGGFGVEAAENNRVEGNYIGTDQEGKKAVPNNYGVLVQEAGTNYVGGTEAGAGNLISGNTKSGVYILFVQDVKVQGNRIGVDEDEDPQNALGNKTYGIEMAGAGSGQVGGTTENAANIIGFNAEDGIHIRGAISLDNMVWGNYVGTNKEKLQLGNGSAGVAVSGDGNTVGGDDISQGNSIEFNGAEGIRIFFGQSITALRNNVFSNQADGIFIDRFSTGVMILANNILLNESAGVRIEGSQNRVGTGLEFGSNTIRNNTGPGIVVAGFSALDNAILHNSLEDNGGLGIDLGDDGPTENDPPGAEPPQPAPVPDQDQGPNGLQNFPVLTQLGDEGLTGVLWSEPETLFRLEFYSSEDCDARGQGSELLAVEFDVDATRSDEDGRLEFSLPLFPPQGTAVTATATRVSDEFELLATSEFSPCLSAVLRPALIVNSPRDADDEEGRTSSDLSPGDGMCSTGGTILRGGADESECTLRAAIEEANSIPGRDRIHFNIPGAAEQYPIDLASNLPTVQAPVEIDGSTQPRTGDPAPEKRAVVIDGEGVSGQSLGLQISGVGPKIRGLELRNFDGGLVLSDSGESQILGNEITARSGGIIFLFPSSLGNHTIGGELDIPLYPNGPCVDPCNLVRTTGRGTVGIGIGGAEGSSGDKIFGNRILGPDDDSVMRGINITSIGTLIGQGSRTGNLVENFAVAVTLEEGANDSQIKGNWFLNRVAKGYQGIQVVSNGNVIGGTNSDHGNTFAVQFPISVSDLARKNEILSNTYRSHARLREPIGLTVVDRGQDNIGENDLQDRDTGANDGQNFPLLTGAALHEGTLTVRGRLNSTPSTDGFRIQIYRSTEPSPNCSSNSFPDSLFEGDLVHLGDAVRDSDSTGDAVFRVQFENSAAPLGAAVMATATDPLGNTSKFSECRVVREDQDGDGVEDPIDADDQDSRVTTLVDPFTGEKTTVKIVSGEVGAILATIFTFGRKGLFVQSGKETVFPGGIAEFQIVPEENGTPANASGISEPIIVEWTISEGLVVDSFYNFGPTEEDPEEHFYEFLFDGETGAEIFENRILLHYVDGIRGDHDLTVNGEILTRGGPVTLAQRFYFPQVGDGLVGNIQLQTSLVVQNTRGITPVELELFNSESEFLTLDLDPLGRGSLFGFGLNPGESVSAQSDGIRDIQAGYAEILAAVGVGGTAVFSRSDAASGTLLYEAGVSATQPLTDFTLFVDSLGDRETGLAVAFPTAGQEALDPAELTLRLYDNEFNQLASTSAQLLPGRHFAGFITQFFAGTPGIDEMQGTVTVSSTEPVVAVTLRQTDDPLRGFPEDVPILTTFPVIPARADLALAGQGDPETVFFPQVGNGIVADIRLQTEFIFVNSGVDAADFTLEFFDSTGAPQEIPLTNGETDSRFDLNLGTGQALTLETDGAGDIQVGYARITGLAGLGGTAVFRRSHAPSGTLLYEAGVPASTTLSDFSLVVDNRGARDTGLAIVVPPSTKSAAEVTIRLYDTDFNLLAEDTLDLAPGSHLPRFASQLFSKVEGVDDLEGALTVSSTQPIAAITILQNDEPGLQFPGEVPTLATFPVIPGRSDRNVPSQQ